MVKLEWSFNFHLFTYELYRNRCSSSHVMAILVSAKAERFITTSVMRKSSSRIVRLFILFDKFDSIQVKVIQFS